MQMNDQDDPETTIVPQLNKQDVESLKSIVFNKYDENIRIN